ncbi:MAG: hypothetical protein GQ572_01955, partial [Gammaproteobacteria bacterium]|nr:hypothetical protein [Gammaproteobacteria bacterium]
MRENLSDMPFRGLFLLFLSVFWLNPAFSACDDEAGPAVNWANCHFTDLDLKNKDLSDAVFTGASFNNADFTDARLDNADFNFAKFENVRFDSARMPGARLVAVKANGVSFKNAMLDNSRFSRSILN